MENNFNYQDYCSTPRRQERKIISNSIDILNDDILKRIFDYLHLDDKIRLRRVCFKWKHLLDEQLRRMRALRIGQFNSNSGYNITSGLHLNCLEHNNNNINQHHFKRINHHRRTASRDFKNINYNKMIVMKKLPDETTLFNEKVLKFPADVETHCYSINRFDLLQRSLKHCYETITILSLGRLNISYRFLIVITHNLPNLEHLELVACASSYDDDNNKVNNQGKDYYDDKKIDSLESFNNEQTINSNEDRKYLNSNNSILNQNNDEQINIRDRLRRCVLVRNCQLIRDSKERNFWPNLKHLSIKDCNLLNEFSLCLIISLTNQTLEHLVIESNQYLTGEFLNYCGANLKLLRIKYCPFLQIKFLEDLFKIKQLLTSVNEENHKNSQQQQQQQQNKYVTSQHQREPLPQPINPSMFKNFANFNQDIYCAL